MNISYKKLAVIGLGYVGLPLAVEFGKSRFTLGFDIIQSRVDELKLGIDGTLEVSSEEIKSSAYLEFSCNLANLDECRIFIITVPTPIDDANRPELTPLKKATEIVANALKVGDIVIYESTVFPGCTEEICVPILEKVSKLIYNRDFFCGYSPERVNPGDKVNTLTTIKKITSGSTPVVADEIDNLYKGIIKAGSFKASSIKIAEAAKVIENVQRDLNIALVNELSLIFDRIGIDTVEVLEAAGSKWNFMPFRPGMVGGHCIGVDPYYLTHKAEQLGYHPQVILAGRKINDEMARYAARNIIKKMSRNGIDVSKSKVAVFGVTFKDNCPDIRNSKVFDMVDELESWGVSVILIDPWADETQVQAQYGYRLTPLSLTMQVDSIVVAVGHKEFKEIKGEQFKSICRSSNPVFGDLKSTYPKAELESAGFTLMRL
jgi:UDP-N-acetyl-D-glucosamine/UDP-N-acetyl-D-galactosamine dehydrogenase